ncbi:Cation channel sperm-associated protein 4 [Coelomomyces lativittatus]|nr:Cation channel sperm-associated protein 4 [Coelomomyces lativittatus]KAJ1516711.1 Cation channel sperm-associated protein 4 [Coelomomyces lativittatus]
MFTLFVIAAQDNWVNIFDELVNNSADYTTVALFMVVYITLGGFVFLNLIVAVVVNNLDQTYDNIKRQLKLKYRQLKSNPMPSTTTTSSSSSQPSQKSSHQANDVARECAALPEGHEGAYQRQIPFEIPMLEDITETKLHKYCLVLMILEENLKEYLKIKEALNEILNEIKLLNQKQSDEEKEAELTADEEEDENPLSLFQSQQSMAADPLSRLIVAQK